MKLLIATRSAHKLHEIREILAGVPDLEVLGLDEAGIGKSPEEEDLEPYLTFEENARSKARYYADRSGLPTVADDSGIEITALGGAPAFGQSGSPRKVSGERESGTKRTIASSFIGWRARPIGPHGTYVWHGSWTRTGRRYRFAARWRAASRPIPPETEGSDTTPSSSYPSSR